MVQLFTSQDSGIRKAADLRLAEEKGRKRQRFRPATFVYSLRSQDHTQNRRALSGAAKTMLKEEEDDERIQALCQLPTHGEMFHLWEDTSPEMWARAIQGLPPEPLKFVLNASFNTLPTNANLHLWGKKATDVCVLCYGARQTLLHILNNCPVVMGLRRYSQRHDAVLEVFGSFIRSHLPSNYSFSIDSPSGTYIFPHHITPTNLRPDIVWWSDLHKQLWLFELTSSHESLVAGARAVA